MNGKFFWKSRTNENGLIYWDIQQQTWSISDSKITIHLIDQKNAFQPIINAARVYKDATGTRYAIKTLCYATQHPTVTPTM